MTPPRLDWRSIERKLVRLRALLDDLVALGPFDARRFVEDRVAGLAAERVLTLLVELAFGVNSHVAVVELGRAPDSYRESFGLAADAGAITRELADALGPSAGLRNVLVHAYLDVDHERVAAATGAAPELFGEYVRQVARWVGEVADGVQD